MAYVILSGNGWLAKSIWAAGLLTAVVIPDPNSPHSVRVKCAGSEVIRVSSHGIQQTHGPRPQDVRSR
jgi:hypothetical protein